MQISRPHPRQLVQKPGLETEEALLVRLVRTDAGLDQEGPVTRPAGRIASGKPYKSDVLQG